MPLRSEPVRLRALAAIVAVGLFGAWPPAAMASDAATIPVVGKPPAATLDDPAWKQGLVVDRLDSRITRRTSSATTAYIVADASAIDVAFFCAGQGPVVAVQTVPDVGFGVDDYVGVGIDASGNGSRVVSFEITPRGVTYQHSSENARFRAGWSGSARVEANGWTAFLRIPYASIAGFTGRPFRLELVRHQAANEDVLGWSPDARIAGDWPAQLYSQYWRDVRLSTAIARKSRPAPAADVFVLGGGGGDRNAFIASDGSVSPGVARHVGLDFRLPLTDTLSAIGTVAPDFSNVESDQAIITPQEFRRQYVESRPFFLQGARFFNPSPSIAVTSPDNILFDTTTLGLLNRGFGVEGTVGLDSIGVLQAGGADYDDVAFSLRHAVADKTFRWYADGVVANHPGVRDQTLEAGLGGRTFRSVVYGLDLAQEVGTRVVEPAAARSLLGYVGISQPSFSFNLTRHDLGDRYDPVDGFTNLADIHGWSSYAELTGVPFFKRFLKNVDGVVYGDRYLDARGDVHEADLTETLDLYSLSNLHLGLSSTTSSLRDYGGESFSSALGSPGGDLHRYDVYGVTMGFRETQSTPTVVGYQFGPYSIGCSGSERRYCPSDSTAVVPIYSRTVQFRQGFRLRASYAGAVELDRNVETPRAGMSDTQSLVRLSLGRDFGGKTSVGVSLRRTTGTGGYATPGTNLAMTLHQHTKRQDFYLNYGSPSTISTLQRLVAKLVWHL